MKYNQPLGVYVALSKTLHVKRTPLKAKMFTAKRSILRILVMKKQQQMN